MDIENTSKDSMYEEILFLRREISDRWHKENRKKITVDLHANAAKAAFACLPVKNRKGKSSFDILWDIYKHMGTKKFTL